MNAPCSIRHQRQHQKAIPLVKGFDGPLPDPRSEPFDARALNRPFVLRLAAEAFAIAAGLGFIWSLLS